MSKLPDYPMPGKSVEQTVRDIIDYLRMTTITNFHGGQMKQSRGGTTLSVRHDIRPKIQQLPYDPFFPILEGNEADGLLLTMLPGNVILRKKKGADANAHILPSAIPNQLSVVVGDKITLKIEEDTDGEFSTAAIVKTSGSWPTSTAPDLDAASASGGVRHIRLCEVVKETDFPEVKIWATGHADHFAPTKLESTSGNDGDVLKEYVDGVWLMRGLTAGAGINITEGADSIEIEAAGETDGWWGEISWTEYVGGEADVLTLYIEGGRIMAVDRNGADVPGTEGSPGGVSFPFST
jgi:hypothetical protein